MTASERLAKVNRDIETYQATLMIIYVKEARQRVQADLDELFAEKARIEAEMQPNLWEAEA
jgi:hypothetical protein